MKTVKDTNTYVTPTGVAFQGHTAPCNDGGFGRSDPTTHLLMRFPSDSCFKVMGVGFAYARLDFCPIT